MKDGPADPLWRRIESFELDDMGADLSFTQRLARDNGWSVAFARRVTLEYKRFCYLTFRAGHPVTPSDEVDQAWHLHLAYTRNYWDDFCGEVLGGPLHHGPTAGGRAEGAKFRAWYEATLNAYRQHFGDGPPQDIWPNPESRFRNAADFRRIDTSRVWLVPKLAVASGRGSLMACLAAVAALVACVEVEAEQSDGLTLLLILVVIALVMIFPPNKNGRGGSGCGGSGCGGCGGGGGD